MTIVIYSRDNANCADSCRSSLPDRAKVDPMVEINGDVKGVMVASSRFGNSVSNLRRLHRPARVAPVAQGAIFSRFWSVF